MTMNPAASQGWVKSLDPNTGRAFYANHVTRVTQWEAPPGWIDVDNGDDDEDDDGRSGYAGPSMEHRETMMSTTTTMDDQSNVSSSSSSFPVWEEMKDPTTGRTFYVNHQTQQTTWTRPAELDAVAEEGGEMEMEGMSMFHGDASQQQSFPPFRAAAMSSSNSVGSNRSNRSSSPFGGIPVVPAPSSHAAVAPVTVTTATSNPTSKSTRGSAALQRVLSAQSHSVTTSTPTPSASGNNGWPPSFSSSASSRNAFGGGTAPPPPMPPMSSASASGSGALKRSYSNASSRASSSSAAAAAAAAWQEHPVYYTPVPTPVFVDLSDSMPPLEFRVQKVSDALRSECGHACGAIFSLSKRRHHCRLCGDVFCDACSNHRVTLPLSGSEFERPVRVCDFCHADVERGNFFSFRRYLTPLALYDPSRQGTNAQQEEEEGGVATAKNVAAALSALTQDLEGMMQGGGGDDDDVASKLSIPIDVLLPAICKHLAKRSTSDRAARALAALLALGTVVSRGGRGAAADDAHAYAHGVYRYCCNSRSADGIHAIDDLLTLLERSGSDRKTLYVQEQAARALFYLTDPSVLRTLAASSNSTAPGAHQDDDHDDADHDGGANHGDPTLALDIPRALRNFSDHASESQNPNLQRWSAATIRNLILEDQRRTTSHNNDIAAAVASGQHDLLHGGMAHRYESCLDDALVQTGGIMILCSLMAADDPDTRAHAMGALGAVLSASRAVDGSLAALHELTGGQAGRIQQTDGAIVRAIVNGGGCGPGLSQLLLSADNGVAKMGCDFAASLVMPLLNDARGTATLPQHYDCRVGGSGSEDGLDACREAALAMASGPCLPALLCLLRDPELGGRIARPMELRQRGIETLSAVVMAVGEMGKANPDLGSVREAITAMTEEGVLSLILAVLESQSSQTLNTRKDTPTSRIREAAGIILSALTQCSPTAMEELQACHGIATMLSAMNDGSAAITSTLRGDGAPRCLGMLQTAAALLMDSWSSSSASSSSSRGANPDPASSSSSLTDLLMEVLDAGVVSTLSRILFTKMDWESQDKAAGAMKARDASCRMLSAIFGIASGACDDDDDNFAQQRLYEIVDADAYSRNPPRNVMTGALGILQKSSGLAKNILLGVVRCGPHYHAAVMDLVESSLLAVGSMSGSSLIPSSGNQDDAMMMMNMHKDRSKDEGGDGSGSGNADGKKEPSEFKIRRQEVCGVACDLLVQQEGGGRSGGGGGSSSGSRGHHQQGSLLPTMLVGGFGEGSLMASMRLVLAIAQNGTMEQHAKLAMSGILVPVSDSLRSALSQGDPSKFSASLALVRFCGPHVAAGEGSGLQSVREAIRVATSVLTIPADPHLPLEQLERQEAIKAECIGTLEALSSNTSLWSSISKDALPAVVSYLHASSQMGPDHGRQTRCAALRAIVRIVRLSSHAVAAARAGLAAPLAKLVAMGTRGDALVSDGGSSSNNSKDEMPLLALEVLHVMASNDDARREARFLDCGVVAAVCHALGNAATDKPRKPVDSRADVTFWGLHILHLFLDDVEQAAPNLQFALQSSSASSLVGIVAREGAFVRALCSTLLLPTNMRVPNLNQDDDDDEHGDDNHDDGADGRGFCPIPRFYGPPLVRVEETCAGYPNTHHAAQALLFKIAMYSCAIETTASENLWKAFLCTAPQAPHAAATSSSSANRDAARRRQLGATFCAQFLRQLLQSKGGPFVPLDARKMEDFDTIARPLVRHRLLTGLVDAARFDKESSRGDDRDASSSSSYMVSMFVAMEVPRVCLTVWQDPALIELAFELLKGMIASYEDDLLHIFVESKATLLSLFDMLNVDASSLSSSSTRVEDIRRVVAGLLGSLAESGMLAQAVERFDIKGGAVGALAAACLAEEESGTSATSDDYEERTATSATMSSRCMQCLVELCTVEEEVEIIDANGKNDAKKKKTKTTKKRIRLSQEEATAIAQRLGKKISQMVVSRFLERSKLQQYDAVGDDDDDDDVMVEAPDVKMLCAIAQHGTALRILVALGGLNALGLIASEGDLSAILALQNACRDDPQRLVEVDGHVSVMKLIADAQHMFHDHEDNVEGGGPRAKLETAGFGLLGDLCATTVGRKAVVGAVEPFQACLDRAFDLVVSLVEWPQDDEDDDEDEDDEDNRDKEDDEDEEEGDHEQDTPALKEEEQEADVSAPAMKQSQVAKPVLKRKKFAVGGKHAMLEAESAALVFLDSLVLVESCRARIMAHAKFAKAVLLLTTEKEEEGDEASSSTALLLFSSAPQLHAVVMSLLTHLVPYATPAPSDEDDGDKNLLARDRLVATLIQTLQTQTSRLPNSLKASIVDAVSVVLDVMSLENQAALISKVVIPEWTALIRKFTVARSSGDAAADRQHGSDLAYSLSSVLLRCQPKDPLRDVIVTKEVLTSMVHLVQWRSDSGGGNKATAVSEDDLLQWDAVLTHCLQVLCHAIMCGPMTSSSAGGGTTTGGGGNKSKKQHNNMQDPVVGMMTTLVKTPLMMARPGKAPRKACDFPTALKRIVEAKGSGCNYRLAARILERVQLVTSTSS